MFSDDEEFFDDLAGIDDSPESLPGSSDEEQFRELMRRRSSIEERMSRVDEMARQMKFAMELQKAMTDCYSNRVLSPPVETSIELRQLSSGSLLTIFSVRNNSSSDLVNWTVTASVCPSTAESASIGSFSQSIVLDSLCVGEEFSSEMLFHQSHLQLPVIVRLQLKKVFHIDGEANCILIDLDSEYLSLRNLLHAVKSSTHHIASEDERSTVMGNFVLRLPFCLVDLLSGCPDDSDPVNVLKVLLPKHGLPCLKAGTSSADVLLVLDSAHKHRARLEVSKESNCFVVSVSLRESALRNRLRQALQSYLIQMASRVLKRPLSNSVSVVGCRTVDELFDTVVTSFSV